jgi:hypothetical protein
MRYDCKDIYPLNLYLGTGDMAKESMSEFKNGYDKTATAIKGNKIL